MADILWLAAMVYSDGTCGTGNLRGVCDVVCWGSGYMYGNRVKEGRRRPESKRAAAKSKPYLV